MGPTPDATTGRSPAPDGTAGCTPAPDGTAPGSPAPDGTAGHSPAVIATLVALPAALVAGLLAFWLLGGFAPAPRPEATGPVEVALPPPAPPQVTAVCRALVGALPDTVDGHRRRPVRGGAERVAAWGEPPIVLRCGVGPPPKTPDEVGINGVFWAPTTVGGDTVWTTKSRSVVVEVRVPAGQAEESGQRIIHPLTGPITATVPPA